MQLLCGSLVHGTGLRELRIGMNGIGPRGAAMLADALSANTGIEMVDLYDNGLGDAGAAAFSAKITSSSLRSLESVNCMCLISSLTLCIAWVKMGSL